MGREISVTLRTSFPPQRHGGTERDMGKKKNSESLSLCVP